MMLIFLLLSEGMIDAVAAMLMSLTFWSWNGWNGKLEGREAYILM